MINTFTNRDKNVVCLVLCPVWSKVSPPYGVALLGAILRKHQYVTTVLDLNCTFYHAFATEDKHLWESESFSYWWDAARIERLFKKYDKLIEQTIQNIINTNCAVVGFSMTTDNKHFSLALAKKLKERQPGIITIMGGPDTSPHWDGLYIIQQEQVDAGLVHDADETFVQTLDMLKNQNKFLEIPGLAFKQGGKIIYGGLPHPVSNLNNNPFPDYSDFDFFQYEHPARLDVMGSRGCVNKCNHCPMTTLYPDMYKARSAQNVFHEIEFQLNKYPHIDFINFNDCLINGSLAVLEELCDLLIARKFNITWEAQAIFRKDMSLQLFQKMYAAGCRRLVYGIETGSNKILKKMNRRHYTVALAEDVLRLTSQAKIKVLANFMFGYPGETERDFQKTIDFVRRNKQYFAEISPQQSFTAILWGTPLYIQAKKFNIEENPHPIYWKSKDGRNTYPVRFLRYKRFWALCKELNLPTVGIFHVSERLLGEYYMYKQDYNKALECYKADIKSKKHSDEIIRSNFEKTFLECCIKTNNYTQENMQIINEYSGKEYKYKASIVIATMNRGEKIIHTLNSLISQDISTELYEVIIVDQCPPSQNKIMVDDFKCSHPQHNIQYLATEIFGLSWARNRGIIESHGEIVVFIDDDAVATRNWLLNICKAFAEHPEVYALGGRVLSSFSGVSPVWLDQRLNRYLSHFDKGEVESFLSYNEYPRGANCAFRRSAFHECGLFLECFGLNGRSKMTYEEIELCYRIEKKGYKILYIPNADVSHLIRSERLGVSWFKQRFYWQGRSEALFRIIHLHCNSGFKLLWIYLLCAVKENDLYQRQYYLGCAVTFILRILSGRRLTLCR